MQQPPGHAVALCALPSGKADVDSLIDAAEKAFWGRFWNIMLMALIMAVLGFFGFMFGQAIHNSVTEYREMAAAAPKRSGAPLNAQFDARHDDEQYADPADALTQNASDYQQYQKYMSDVKQRYAEYNRAAAQYAAQVEGKEVQDVIDERIMQPEYDDYMPATTAT